MDFDLFYIDRLWMLENSSNENQVPLNGGLLLK